MYKCARLSFGSSLRPRTTLTILLYRGRNPYCVGHPDLHGMMQFVHHVDHPGNASVMFLPIIDMNSSDTTCIYSTMAFVIEHARRHGVSPIITFDQPLWWKALMIIRSEPLVSDLKRIILRLGGFHAETSFLGCIEHGMASSGLQGILDLVYAPNALVQVLSDKAIARAVSVQCR